MYVYISPRQYRSNCSLFKFQTVNNRMKQMIPKRTSTVVTEAEIKLSESFLNLHAQLQVLEDKIRENVVANVNSSYHKLSQVATELDNNVKALTGLLNFAKSIVNGGGSQKKINVQMVMEKLQNVKNVPCCLVGKQIVEGGVR